jgi:hypothetical protein
VLGVGVAAWPYTVDDAFITARYACHLAAGSGYAMNPPQTSDGVTGPLWLVPEIVACRLALDPIAIAKALGLTCAVLATWLVLYRLRARSGGSAAACVAALLLAISPSLGTWAVAGLETGLATLLVTIAAIAATHRVRPRAVALGLAVAALAWLRPELALLCTVLLIHAALRDLRVAAKAIAIALGGTAALLAFRLLMFGDAVPLSFHAKPGSLAHGARYVLTGIVLATSLAGAGLAVWGALRGRRSDRVLGAAVALHVASVMLAGGDWMPGYRLLVPVLPLYAVLAGVGAARAARAAPRRTAAIVVLACVLPALDLATRIPELRASAGSRDTVGAGLARELGRHARSVALLDVGYLGYATGIEVVDLGGLTDPRVARMRGGHLSKRIEPAYLRARDPDAIVLHSTTLPRVTAAGELRSLAGYEVEQRVAAMPFVRERYRVAAVLRYAPHYHYVLLARRGSRLEAIGERHERHAE